MSQVGLGSVDMVIEVRGKDGALKATHVVSGTTHLPPEELADTLGVEQQNLHILDTEET